MSTVVLVRHGETTWNRDRRIQGWAPAPLTDRGRKQAAELATAIDRRYSVDRLVSSDLRRAIETARAIGRETGVTPEPARGWRERDFGVLQGLDYEECFLGYPEFALSEVGYRAAEARPEGGERLVDQRDRVLDAWERLLEELGPEETAVVVTHGGSLYILLGHLNGLDLTSAVLDRDQGNCAINEVAIDPDTGEASVVRENDTDYPTIDR